MFFKISALLLVTAFVVRVLHVIKCKKNGFFNSSARTLIVIGSGGHTSEMIKQLTELNPRLYQPRLYVLARGDLTSRTKIKELESNFGKLSRTHFSIKTIPRSRNVGQPYLTSIFTTLRSLLACFPVVFSFKPDLILCNGPGTCIPICLVGFLMKVLFITQTRIVYTESICRVQSLSLSGKIQMIFADKVLVQWPELKKKYPKAEYIGRLV